MPKGKIKDKYPIKVTINNQTLRLKRGELPSHFLPVEVDASMLQKMSANLIFDLMVLKNADLSQMMERFKRSGELTDRERTYLAAILKEAINLNIKIRSFADLEEQMNSISVSDSETLLTKLQEFEKNRKDLESVLDSKDFIEAEEDDDEEE